MHNVFHHLARQLAIFCLLAWPVAAFAAEDAPAAAKPAAAMISNDKCLECHDDKDLTKDLAGGKTVSLFVDEKIRQASVHAKLACAECHSDLSGEHPDDVKPVKPVKPAPRKSAR